MVKMASEQLIHREYTMKPETRSGSSQIPSCQASQGCRRYGDGRSDEPSTDTDSAQQKRMGIHEMSLRNASSACVDQDDKPVLTLVTGLDRVPPLRCLGVPSSAGLWPLASWLGLKDKGPKERGLQVIYLWSCRLVGDLLGRHSKHPDPEVCTIDGGSASEAVRRTRAAE